MNSGTGTPPPTGRLFLTVLIAITAIGPLSTQMFLPALPAMQAEFAISTAAAQLALSAAFLALAFSEVAYGPWSDRSGRRPVVMFGLALFLAGNAICLIAGNIEVLVAGRILQACGGSVGIVLSRAIAVDAYGPEKATTVVSLTTAAMALAPMLAPVLGGVLTDQFGWRSTFVFQLAAGAVVLAAVWSAMPETNRRRQADMTPAQMLAWFARMMRERDFARYALNVAGTMGVFFTFISAAPYVTVTVMGRPATEFGLWFMAVAAGYVVGNLVSARIAERVGAERMVLGGSLLGLASIAAVALALTLGSWSPWALFVPGAITACAAGLALPSAQVRAVARFPAVAGTASALIGFLIMLVGALAAQVSGLVQDETPYPMVIAMAVLSLGALIAVVARSRAPTAAETVP